MSELFYAESGHEVDLNRLQLIGRFVRNITEIFISQLRAPARYVLSVVSVMGNVFGDVPGIQARSQGLHPL